MAHRNADLASPTLPFSRSQVLAMSTDMHVCHAAIGPIPVEQQAIGQHPTWEHPLSIQNQSIILKVSVPASCSSKRRDLVCAHTSGLVLWMLAGSFSAGECPMQLPPTSSSPLPLATNARWKAWRS
ncbi:hypothetical protein F444_00127 [Phytophthora nicotianae P1976]|uniref:Uncharacterized protein n=1 Tax=Phytophthora nicotianae P1976 TaxID=1317066 RepID=A0A081B596_PHYNI|nr:hypothetical protein F444_00127 [Phytophthora nicotianae P1976]